MHIPFHLFAFLAQAGGGGSFGSGGGGGSISGGGSGDLSIFIYLAFRYPWIGIPLLIALLVVGAKSGKRGVRSHRGRVIRKTRLSREIPAPTSTVSLTINDPGFDEERFLRRTALAFTKAQEAWCQQDLTALRNFVSDGVFERFSLQVAEQTHSGWRQEMQGLTVGQLSIVALNIEGPFDALTVHVPFECTISKLDAKSKTILPGSTLPERRFAECWTFLRRRGTKSLDANGLIEGQCPNCGATLEMVRTSRCSVCESEVLSGQFDWVLTEITQASIWQPKAEQSPALATYLSADPDLSTALFEDRASVAFWRLRLAEKHAEAGPLLSVSTEIFARDLVAKWPTGNRRLVRVDCAVGSLETLGVLTGEERDRVVLEVIWDSRRIFSDQLGGDLPQGPRTLERDLLIFSRPSGQTTRWKTTFTTAHCQHCSGLDTGDLSDKCPWCGEPRRGGKDNWLLEQVLPRASSTGRDLLAALGGGTGFKSRAPAKRQLLTWAASLAAADGQLSKKERDALARIALRAGLSATEIDSLTPEDMGIDQWQAEAPPAGPVDSTEARAWLIDLVALAHADGNIDRSEERWLTAAAKRLGFTPADLRLVIKKEAARLFQEAKALREKPLLSKHL